MINLLFIGTPSKSTTENQKLLSSNILPVKGRFEETPIGAFSHLERCDHLNFPDVIILDHDMKEEDLNTFLKIYRQDFYLGQMDTLLFISSDAAAELKVIDKYPLVAGYLPKRLSKPLFLKEIYPMITFTMV